jgi:hypothetical protein
MVEIFVLMSKNGKMRRVETIPRMRREEIKENDEGVKLNCYIL